MKWADGWKGHCETRRVKTENGKSRKIKPYNKYLCINIIIIIIKHWLTQSTHNRTVAIV